MINGGHQNPGHEVAAAPGFRAGPVDLGRDPVEGIIVDRFRLQSRRARAGAPAKKGDVPGTVVVAYPQTCGGTSTPALGIALSGRQGPAIEPTSLITDRAAVQAVLPGAEIPAGSIAATFAVDALLNGFGVRLSFPPSVCVGPTAERLPVIQYRGAELATPSMPVRPSDDDSGVAFVAVQAIVDHQGRFQQLRPLGGPPTLVRAALAAVAQWQAQPARANGAPVATAVVLRVTFEAAGKQ